MKFIADENIPQSIINRIKHHGHIVEDSKKILPSAPDLTILEHAEKNDALVLTYDKDFLTPALMPKHTGVIVLHFPKANPNSVLPWIDQLLEFLTNTPSQRPFRIVLTKEKINITSF